MVNMNNYPLSEEVIKEFTTQYGMHFRLAHCEHIVTGGRKIPTVLYLTDDKKTYTREIHGGCWVANDNTQIGIAVTDVVFFTEAERMKFIKWL